MDLAAEPADGGPALLTVDLGNSGGSAALVRRRGGVWVARVLDGWPAREELAGLALALGEAQAAGRLVGAAVSAVGDVAREAAVVGWLEGQGLAVAARPDAGLELRIDFPETCGSDRQYAVRGALEEERARGGGAARVLAVDVGTALTVDAGSWRDGEGPAFLGGAIALGPGAHARALTAAGARLPAFDLEGEIPALGRSTRGALRSGVAVGLVGAVGELVERIAAEAFGGLEGVGVYLTGGARGFVEERLARDHGAALRVRPALVHAGLAHGAAASLGGDVR